jgi:hypothetical protein
MARTLSELSTAYGWTPADVDPNHGGPDTTNPLLNEDGSCAISPGTVEPRGFSPAGGGAVIASEGAASRDARLVHDRRGAGALGIVGRRVTLTWPEGAGTGVDVELVRRAHRVTRGGAGRTRFRHPMLDAAGPVETAPWVQIVPGTLRIARSRGGVAAAMSVEIEYVATGYAVSMEGEACTMCDAWMADNATSTVGGEAAYLLASSGPGWSSSGGLAAAASLGLASLEGLLEDLAADGITLCNMTDAESIVLVAVGDMGTTFTGTSAELAATSQPGGENEWTVYLRCGDQVVAEA